MCPKQGGDTPPKSDTDNKERAARQKAREEEKLRLQKQLAALEEAEAKVDKAKKVDALEKKVDALEQGIQKLKLFYENKDNTITPKNLSQVLDVLEKYGVFEKLCKDNTDVVTAEENLEEIELVYQQGVEDVFGMVVDFLKKYNEEYARVKDNLSNIEHGFLNYLLLKTEVAEKLTEAINKAGLTEVLTEKLKKEEENVDLLEPDILPEAEFEPDIRRKTLRRTKSAPVFRGRTPKAEAHPPPPVDELLPPPIAPAFDAKKASEAVASTKTVEDKAKELEKHSLPEQQQISSQLPMEDRVALAKQRGKKKF